MAPLILSLCTK